MNTFSRKTLILSLVGTLLLSACGHSDSSLQSADDRKDPPAAESPVSALADPAQAEADADSTANENTEEIGESDFEPGVFIDFDAREESFLNEEIISKMKTNLKAIADRDRERFKEILQDDPAQNRELSYFFGAGDKQFMFYDLDLVEQQEDLGQIRIGVLFARKQADDSIVNQGITYFFMQNETNEWEIVNID